MTGKPVFAASEREKVLFPDPAIPVTRTRRPIPKAASLIDSQCPSSAVLGASTGRKQQPAPPGSGHKPGHETSAVRVFGDVAGAAASDCLLRLSPDRSSPGKGRRLPRRL